MKKKSNVVILPTCDQNRVIYSIPDSPFRFGLTPDTVVLQKLYSNNRPEYFYPIILENIFWGGKIKLPMYIEPEYTHRILWIYELTEEEYQKTGEYAAKGGNKAYFCSYTNDDGKINFIMFHTLEQVMKRFVHMKCSSANYEIKDGHLNFSGYINLYTEKSQDITVNKSKIIFDVNNHVEISLHLNSHKNIKGDYITHSIPLETIVSQETEINNPLHIDLTVNNVKISFNIGKKESGIKETKFYYLPYSSEYIQNYAVFIRKNIKGNYTLVIRPKESIEYNEIFLQLESEKSSRKLYYKGKLKRVFHKKPINLYYEKYSMQAEEGTWEVFCKALESSKSKNYFILDMESPEWDRLKNCPQGEYVIAKYSEEYYNLLFESDALISTETSSHLNVFRAANYYVRKALIERPFIFLQHGVTYLKRQGNTSAFVKGKENEPDYIIVDSEKEAEIVSKMLKLDSSQCVKTGLPVFDTIEYNHINDKSDNIITVMLTWKPSEEYLLTHFEDSTYYKYTKQIYSLLTNKLSKEQINIVAHPKIHDHLKATSIGDQVWQGTVKDALAHTKLLITDYSSTCYNVFYQGAAVIFYQPDLESYEKEVGRLIPKDDEYIGYRVFLPYSSSPDELSLEDVLNKGIIDGKISLSYLRNEEFQNRYKKINEFCDGRNVERIIEFLKEKGFV